MKAHLDGSPGADLLSEGRVVAGHTTAMGSYNDAYAFKLLQILKRAGVTIVANPLDNIVLQGRFDSYPKRRGMTRVKELDAAGTSIVYSKGANVADPVMIKRKRVRVFSTVTARRFCDQQEMSSHTATGRSLP